MEDITNMEEIEVIPYISPTNYHVTLSDGTAFDAVSDGAGNMMTEAGLEESVFSSENLSTITVSENGAAPYTLRNQVLRMFAPYMGSMLLIKFGDKTELETLREENAMLTECVLEMSELIYA